MPEVTLSLPAALGFLALFITIGAVLVFFTLRGAGKVVESTATPTVTITPTVTLTPTATFTTTPLPTFTPLPDLEHTVASGETCTSLAIFYNVSVSSIVTANGLSTTCDTLTIGQVLKIPQPTPTASPQPTSTASGAESTDTACEKVDYTVQDGDTLGSIAANYNVTQDSLKTYNGLVNDVVYVGAKLVIPLCERKTIDGNTPTPTSPPPYNAPSLLLPMNGASYGSADEAITLQWSSVGTLRSNEAYAVTIEDVTYAAVSGNPKKTVEYVTDNKLIIPTSMRPTDDQPHLFQWSVVPVRQYGTTTEGSPVWQTAGTTSEIRGFIWSGGGGVTTAPTEPAATATP